MKKKKKNIAISLGGRIGLSRFLGKILPEVKRSVEIFSQNTKCTDLYCPKRRIVSAALSLLDFLFFVGKYYTQKVLVVFVFLNPFGKKKKPSQKKSKGFFSLGLTHRRK